MFHRKRLQKRPPEIPRIRCEQLALLSRESEMALQTMRESLFDLEEINAPSTAWSSPSAVISSVWRISWTASTAFG